MILILFPILLSLISIPFICFLKPKDKIVAAFAGSLFVMCIFLLICGVFSVIYIEGIIQQTTLEHHYLQNELLHARINEDYPATLVMKARAEEINEIIDNATWWNKSNLIVFFYDRRAELEKIP